MVFIGTSNSQVAIKAAQSGCPGRTVGAGGQQKQARVGGSTPATGGCCCCLPAPATSAARWPARPIKPSQRLGCLGAACLLGSAAVQTCVLGAPPAGIFFSICLICAFSPVFEVVAYGVWATSSKQAKRQSSCPLHFYGADLRPPVGTHPITC